MKLPSLLKIPSHALRTIFFPGTPRRVTIGLILFLLNFLVGWGGISLFATLCARYHKVIYLYLATACYVLSWLMLLVSLYLAGPAAIRALKKRIPLAWKAWKRCFNFRKGQNSPEENR